MNTYRELLDKLLTLSDEQLDSDIINIIDMEHINTNGISLIVSEYPLYSFCEVGSGKLFYEFVEEQEAIEDYGEVALCKNLPVLVINL